MVNFSKKEFILAKEKEFKNAYGEVLRDLGSLMVEDDDFEDYERLSWAISYLNKMVQAFEQIIVGYKNEFDKIEENKKADEQL